jgi:hypothetical protein
MGIYGFSSKGEEFLEYLGSIDQDIKSGKNAGIAERRQKATHVCMKVCLFRVGAEITNLDRLACLSQVCN